MEFYLCTPCRIRVESVSENVSIPDRSIAVLPLVNLSPDPENEYFSDGMTEEIINALNTISGLKVTARTSSFSFKNKGLDVREIGKQLGVRSVLEGSVRKAGDRLRITVQLAEAVDGYQLWSESFDRKLEDVFALQDEISLLVADKIRENFGHLEVREQLVPKATDDVEAYELFLKGRQLMLHWSETGISEAIVHYKRAIELDGRFARAYYEMICCYYLLGAWNALPMDEVLHETEMPLQQAAAINTALPEYHFCLATRSFWLEWDFNDAQKHLQNTLALNEQYTVASENLAELYIATGYFEEALQQIDRCLKVDPLASNHHYTKASALFLQGRFIEALPHYMRALELNPEFVLARNKVAIIHMLTDNSKGLQEILPKVREQEAVKHLFELMNDADKPLNHALAQQLVSRFSLTPWGLYLKIHGGELEEATTLLKKQLDQKRGQIINFRFDPMLQPLLHSEEIRPYLPIEFRLNPTEQETDNIPYDDDGAGQLLQQLMTEEQVYLDPDLNLRSLAERMEMTPNRLSWLINEVMRKNFNEYVNGYRLETFKQKALDPANRNFTLLGLAYESGFNSKSVFNQFFKKTTGITPRAWVKARQLEK